MMIGKRLERVKQLPCWSKKTFHTVISFYTRFVNLISYLGYKNIFHNQHITEKNILRNRFE